MAENIPSLLLLAPPPQPANPAALKAAYEPPLKAAISKLKDEKDGAPQGSVLVVGVVLPLLKGNGPQDKSLSWPVAQSILAGCYSIVSVICAQLQISTEIHAGPGSVDVRVILVDHDLSKSVPADFKAAVEPNSTAVVDLPTFASAFHPWKYVFHASDESGHQLRSTYLKLSESIWKVKEDQVVSVPGGLAFNAESAGGSQDLSQTEAHPVVCLGGTFDHLHPGHKLLLTAAVLLLKVPPPGTKSPCKFVIGITGDELLKQKQYAELVQKWEERALGIIEFLTSVLQISKHGFKDEQSVALTKIEDGKIVAQYRGGTVEVECVKIEDQYGPTITTENMDALVVSGETRAGGNAVNEKRAEKGWRPLQIFEVDVLDAEGITEGATKTQDFAAKISSTAIRKKKAESRM
ncbi:hypothetical protein F4780DRAFT_391623 [Xylariomycetidae sp. FL0641]|nr:hypothetical protein F4780DRAFT_391623 [Xylariomycetidae sp. FL0641]